MSLLSKDEFLQLDDKARETYVKEQMKEIGLMDLRFLAGLVEPYTPSYKALLAKVQSLESKSGGARKQRARRHKTRKSKKRNN